MSIYPITKNIPCMKILVVCLLIIFIFPDRITAQTKLMPVAEHGMVNYFPELVQPVFSNKKRGIWVYTPPNYDTASVARYPVLYMHDGQNLFDARTSYAGEWGIDEAMDSLIKKGIKPSIVVGIDNGADRIREYNPSDNDKYGTSLADDYLNFIIKQLKPLIDSTYKTKPDAANTMIAGSSLGGLVSYYAAVKYQNVFSKAGFFSSSFWIDSTLTDLQPVQKLSTTNKYFFYMGEKEGQDNIAFNEQFATNMAMMGNAIIFSYTLPSGEHNEEFWKLTFPIFYKWMMASGANVEMPIE